VPLTVAVFEILCSELRVQFGSPIPRAIQFNHIKIFIFNDPVPILRGTQALPPPFYFLILLYHPGSMKVICIYLILFNNSELLFPVLGIWIALDPFVFGPPESESRGWGSSAVMLLYRTRKHSFSVIKKEGFVFFSQKLRL
jgi:hypothetical protein